MLVLGFIVWAIVTLTFSWLLGSLTVDRIGLPIGCHHLEKNILVILLVGFIELIIIWVVLKMVS